MGPTNAAGISGLKTPVDLQQAEQSGPAPAPRGCFGDPAQHPAQSPAQGPAEAGRGGRSGWKLAGSSRQAWLSDFGGFASQLTSSPWLLKSAAGGVLAQGHR